MTIHIKVLGSGCLKCNRVEQRAVEALEALSEQMPSLEATIQHITEQNEIMAYPIMVTPALVVDEQVVCSGRVPQVEEVIEWLRAASSAQGAT